MIFQEQEVEYKAEAQSWKTYRDGAENPNNVKALQSGRYGFQFQMVTYQTVPLSHLQKGNIIIYINGFVWVLTK